jgi:hypothetical protein
MWFDDLQFVPHRRASLYPGKMHALATLPNGATISVVFTPDEPLGPNEEPYEVQSSALDGQDGDGIFYAMTPEDVQAIIDETAKQPGTP